MNGIKKEIYDTIRNGKLKDVQWLFYKYPDIKINQDIFKMAIDNWKIEVAIWLLDNNSDIDISADNEYAFRKACYDGKLWLVEWLLEIKPYINISANNNEAFMSACGKLHVELANYLVQLNPNMDIYDNDKMENIFIRICDCGSHWGLDYSNGHDKRVKIAQLIHELCPNKYHLEMKDKFTVAAFGIKQSINNKIKIEKEQIVNCLKCNDKLANIQTKCNHFYCEDCIRTWLSKSNNCLDCNEMISYKDLYKITI